MKNIKSSYFYLLLLVVFSFTSCSKDDSSNSTSINGTSNGDYWPMAINNEWMYEDNYSEQTSVKLTGKDNFGGTNYYRTLEENEYNLQVWLAKKGGTYFEKTSDLNLSQSGLTMVLKGYEIPLFKDYLNVNETWSGSTTTKLTYSYNGESGSEDIKILYNGIILDKSMTVTVNGINYTDVIKSKIELEVISSGNSDFDEIEYWFAKDIGPIYQKTTSSGETNEMHLIDYILN